MKTVFRVPIDQFFPNHRNSCNLTSPLYNKEIVTCASFIAHIPAELFLLVFGKMCHFQKKI